MGYRKACWNCKNYEMKLNEHNYGYEWCNFHNKRCVNCLNHESDIIYCNNWQNGIDELTDEEKAEVLDILAKYLKVHKCNNIGGESIIIDKDLDNDTDDETTKDFNKVKEWLDKDGR